MSLKAKAKKVQGFTHTHTTEADNGARFSHVTGKDVHGCMNIDSLFKFWFKDK